MLGYCVIITVLMFRHLGRMEAKTDRQPRLQG